MTSLIVLAALLLVASSMSSGGSSRGWRYDYARAVAATPPPTINQHIAVVERIIESLEKEGECSERYKGYVERLKESHLYCEELVEEYKNSLDTRSKSDIK